jgi:O-antigen/teichoic acid export membrane protein
MNNSTPIASELVERTPWYLCLLADRFQFVRIVATFALMLWMAWSVGADDFGYIQAAIAMSAILATITSLGIEESVRTALKKNPEKTTAILGTGMALRGAAGIIGFAALFFFAPHNPDLKRIWLTLGLVSVTQTPLVMAWWLEQNPHRQWARIAALSSFIFTALFLIVLLRHGAATVWFAAALVFEQPVFALIVFVMHLKLAPYEDTFEWDAALARAWLRESRSRLGLALVPLAFVPLTQLVSLAFASGDENGQFALALTFYSFGLFALHAILQGRRTERSVERNGSYTSVEAPAGIECYDAAKLGWIVALITAATSSGLIYLFLNAEYHRAIWAALPLSFSLVPSAIGWVRDQRMIRAQNRGQLVRWQLIGSAINMLLAAACIHFLGAIGASAALLVSSILINLGATHYTAEAPRLSRAQWRALMLATAWLKARRSPPAAPIGGTITPFPLTTNAQS